MNSLALSLKALGRYDEAAAAYDELLAAAEPLYGRHNDTFATFLMNKASMLDDIDRYEEAERLYDEAWETLVDVVGPSNPHAVSCRANMGGLYVRTKQWERAREAYESCLPRMLEIDGERSRRVALTLNNLGLALEALGEVEPAIATLERAREVARAIDSDQGYRSIRARAHLARLLARRGADLPTVLELLPPSDLEHLDPDYDASGLIVLREFARGLAELASGDGVRARATFEAIPAATPSDFNDDWVASATRARLASLRLGEDGRAAQRELERAAAELEALLGARHPESLAARSAAAAGTALGR